MKKKVTEDEYNLTYAALKIVETLFRDGKIKQHVFQNILNDYRDFIDISQFKCYA